MKFLGLRSIVVKEYNHAGSSKADNNKEYKNLIEQDFFANKPGQKWVGDITYIYTKETNWTYFSDSDLFEMNEKHRIFIVNSFNCFKHIFNYANICSWEKTKNKYIELPVNEKDDIDYDYIIYKSIRKISNKRCCRLC